jgi:Glu-tRNA(Gln) amidotransferase subunit E-like FAD-binding protein
MLDYEKLKFKSGLEIHQQLDSNKLFCNCPSVLRSDEPDFEIHRRLHAVAGEKGEVDIAAQYQAGLKKEFIYQGYNTNCLIELDEEPPHEINKEALKIALQVAILLNCKIIPLTQIMRKTVIDGSNTSGFQRTVLIARDGYIETSFGRVGIDTLCLEEDSARKVRVEKGRVIYRLDRLGIPLVEIATAPDIKNAEQAKEVALYLGDVLRSCKVKRGLGTIRQDVNVSIKNENRVEIKGVQNMKTFTKVIENEVQRQLKLSESGKPTKSEVRNALDNAETEFLRPMPGADRMYPETDLPLLKISHNLINEIKKDLPKLRKDIQGELKEKGLNEEMIKLILKENKIQEFGSLLEIYNKPNFVAKMILLFPKEISSKIGKNIDISDFYGDVLIALSKKKISEGDVKDILMKIAKGESFKDAIKIEKIDIGDIEEKIMKLIKSKPGLNANAYMGLIMKEFKGKVNGMEIMEVIKKFIK